MGEGRDRGEGSGTETEKERGNEGERSKVGEERREEGQRVGSWGGGGRRRVGNLPICGEICRSTTCALQVSPAHNDTILRSGDPGVEQSETRERRKNS